MSAKNTTGSMKLPTSPHEMKNILIPLTLPLTSLRAKKTSFGNRISSAAHVSANANIT